MDCKPACKKSDNFGMIHESHLKNSLGDDALEANAPTLVAKGSWNAAAEGAAKSAAGTAAAPAAETSCTTSSSSDSRLHFFRIFGFSVSASKMMIEDCNLAQNSVDILIRSGESLTSDSKAFKHVSLCLHE